MSTKIDEKIYYSSSGSREYAPLKYKYDDECKCMVPYFDKPLDRFKMIQASKNSTDIAAIVQRADAGDITALHVHGDEYYGDVSDVPTNINDINEQKLNAINSFYKMDPKIRNLFNNDVNEFLESLEDNSYVEKINSALKPVDNGNESVGDK